MSEAVTCPACRGKGKLMAFVDGRTSDGQSWGDLREIGCLSCEGAGEITHVRAERMLAGARMRSQRIAEGKTLREAAAERGMSPAELSAIESGWSRPTCHGSGVTKGEE